MRFGPSFRRRALAHIAVAILASYLMLGVGTDNALSAPVCSRVGATRILKSVRYSCVRIGNRREWRAVRATVSTPPSNSSAISPTTSTTAPMSTMAGDGCETIGKRLSNSSGLLECRPVAGGRRHFVQLSTGEATASIPAPPQAPVESRASYEMCKIRDQRASIYQPWNVAFPLGDRSGSTRLAEIGVSTVALLAVDFPDAVGTLQELTAVSTQVEAANLWLAHFSAGRKAFDWRTNLTWIRMPKASTEYSWKEPSRVSTAQAIVDQVDSTFNFSGIEFIFVVLPKALGSHARDGAIAINRSLHSSEGRLSNFFGGGTFFYETENGYERELWSAWIHEWLHPVGLPGHGSRMNLDVMNNQNGKSVVLNAWDSYLLGWSDWTETYCVDAATLTNIRLRLVPLERRQRGLKSIMVRLSDSEVLVIESRRAEGWGSRLGVGNYGLMVYVINATRDINRADEGSWDGVSNYETYSTVLRPASVSANDFKLRERLVYEGESVSYAGITVALSATGDNDLISITR